MLLKVKDLILLLSKENQEAYVFCGHDEDFGPLQENHHINMISRGERILNDKELYDMALEDKDSEQPYSVGAMMHEMVSPEVCAHPWVCILS